MKTSLFADLLDQFDIFLLDQFGVLIGGDGAYPGATDAVAALLDAGKTVIVITNSGKRSAHTAQRLQRHGFPMTNVHVVSSGEVARARLADQIARNGPLHVWYEAENREASSLDGLAASYVDTVEEADLLLIAGVRSEDAALSAYEAPFQKALAAGTPCMCTNPDMKRLTPSGIRFAAGQIAKTYEDMGGSVEWIGKPHRAIYDHALLNVPKDARVVCVGDSLAHDIVGGRGAGLSSVLVRTGLSSGKSEAALIEAAEAAGAMPDYLISALAIDN